VLNQVFLSFDALAFGILLVRFSERIAIRFAWTGGGVNFMDRGG